MDECDRPAVEQGPIEEVLARFGSPLALMTSEFEGERAGVLVRSIQVCSTDPVLLSIVIPRGHAIDPLIRDSHAFAICLLGDRDRLVCRKFVHDPKPEGATEPDEAREDPFDSFRVFALATGSPIIDRCGAVLDCEVVRHFDLEVDHEIYVGHVMAARVFARDGDRPAPAVNGESSPGVSG